MEVSFHRSKCEMMTIRFLLLVFLAVSMVEARWWRRFRHSRPTPDNADAGWGPWRTWSTWSHCSLSCIEHHQGFQLRVRERECKRPNRPLGGISCSGFAKSIEVRMCTPPRCPSPVNGQWSPWNKWTEFTDCSKPCGGGIANRTRSRECDSPPPAHGGRYCYGYGYFAQWRKCNVNPCPVDGRWSQWSEWVDEGDCSSLCGNGTMTQKRLRKCDNPNPAHGGHTCDGESSQARRVQCTAGICTEMCASGSAPYIAHPDRTMFYQCDQGVAYIHHCAAGTRWDQSKLTCVHLKTAAGSSTRESSKGCPLFGFAALPFKGDCHKYIQCAGGRENVMECPKGTVFDLKIRGCNHASLVKCN